MNWLLYGDRNITFFHRIVTVWRNRNTVKGLVNESGHWVSDNMELVQLATSYFKTLFTSYDVGDTDRILSLVESRCEGYGSFACAGY